MNRRELIALFGSAAAVAWPKAMWAEQPQRPPTIGFLGLQPASAFASRIEAHRKGLHEAVPDATRIGVFWNPTGPALRSVHAAAEALSVRLHEAPTQRIEDYDKAVSILIGENVNSFLVLASPIGYSDNAAPLIELALTHRLAGMFGYKENVQAGGLMCYSPDVLDLYRRSAVYIGKILKGAKPADLPVEQASKYELTINLNTARALGITIPPMVLARADEVIE